MIQQQRGHRSTSRSSAPVIYTGSYGLRIFFGELEAKILSALWETYPEPITTQQIAESGDVGKIQSINTSLMRLAEKGLVVRCGLRRSEDGRARQFLWRAELSETDTIRSLIATALDTLFREYPNEYQEALHATPEDHTN